ncbi:MAG: hypothetical protein ACRCYZ_05970 [Alphaproteobacteria bacterium]
MMQKIQDLRDQKRKEKEKRKSVNPEVRPLSPLVGFPGLIQISEKNEQGLKEKKSPPPKRPESPKRTFFKQPSAGAKEEKKRLVNLEIQPLASDLIDRVPKEETYEGSFILGLKKSPPPERPESSKKTLFRQPSAEGSFLLKLKEKKPRFTLKDFFGDYFQIVAEKKFENTPNVFYFENSNSKEEFEKAVNQMLFSEAYKPLILPVAGGEQLSPLVFAMGTLNQVFFTRFSDQPLYVCGEKVNPVVQSRFDCLYAWEFIEQLNGFQQGESKKNSLFSDVSTTLEEMKENMRPVFDFSLEIHRVILNLAETAPPETLEKIGTALYIALYDSFPYTLFPEDFKNPRGLIDYLELLARHYLATAYFFNPESVRERFEFQGIQKRQALVEALNHTAKRFKKPPFDHDPGRFEATRFLVRYVSALRQEAENWVESGFKSLAQAFK